MKELDDFLEHSGVKGMKWGIRRSDSTKRRKEKQSLQK